MEFRAVGRKDVDEVSLKKGVKKLFRLMSSITARQSKTGMNLNGSAPLLWGPGCGVKV